MSRGAQLYDFGGELLSVAEIASRTGVSRSSVFYRLKNGNDITAPSEWDASRYIGLERNRLRVVGICKRKARHLHVLVECTCGAEKIASLKHIISGKISSCGCAHLEALSGGKAPERVTLFGVEMSIGQLASLAGRKPVAIWARLRRGMTVEEAAFGRKEQSAT